ncbi:M23 family metallopeptidase [Cupriavidus necator]|uniref:peptidase M23 n=1 Tax=Cupriavidus necator TaxID=106590 RepID=UPI0039C098C8
MIISPPYLPRQNDPAADAMDAIKDRELFHGIYPICSDRRWHGGCHIAPLDADEPVRAIADGEVIAYRVCQYLEGPDDGKDSSAGFVLLKHETETGENRTLRFYSLYMHLRHLGDYVGTGCDPNRLPQWLRMPTEAASGDGKKVYRKDILGWTGECHGKRFLHFEIFMTKEDFDAYFNATQLGNESPSTPATTDYWGNSYFVIPAGTRVLAQPPGTTIDADGKYKLHGIEFPLLQSCEATERKLYVEVQFRGDKNTRVWQDDGTGQRTLLTAEPIKELEYEYDLYHRATQLYKSCPSDGYEMLRFGRILSTPATLSEAASTTWFKVAFDKDKAGYIDISNSQIIKLSDADFPSFMGWKKLTEGSGPFASDGLCDIESLKMILKDNHNAHNPHENINVNQELQYYVQMASGVRNQLRGLVCEMASEWDKDNNQKRYEKLKADGEFYAGDEAGYDKFIKSLDKFQFWGEASLPTTTSNKLWFFHPLEFIRHFRRCNWLSADELSLTFPRHLFYSNQGSPRTPITTAGETYTIVKREARKRIAAHTPALNRCIRKYIGPDKKRISIFLAQVLLETAQWRNLGRTRRLLHEWGFGSYSSANPATQFYGPFYGRGIMQITWAGNYKNYGKFKMLPSHSGGYVERLSPSAPRITSTSTHYTANPSDGGQRILWFPRYDPDLIGEDREAACDSGGFYWVSKSFSVGLNINRVADRDFSADNMGFVNRLVNGGGNGYYERQAYSVYILRALSDDASQASMVTIQPSGKSAVQVDMTKPD